MQPNRHEDRQALGIRCRLKAAFRLPPGTPPSGGSTVVPPAAFTLVEIMVAMAMFMLVMGSVMACWKCVINGTETAQRAAAMAQRSRISMKTVEDALNNMEISSPNIRFYGFVADTSDPQYASLSFAARLPPSFLGSDYFGDHVMRRVNFNIIKDQNSVLNLVMTQYPLLEVPNDNFPPKSIVLARDVSAFVLEFWSPKENDWLADFTVSNEVPPMVRITLGTGHAANDPKTPFEVISRVVAPAVQAHGGGVPGPGGPGGLGVNPAIPALPGR